MGFIRANIIPIMEEHRNRPFSGNLLLLGQGDVYFTQNNFENMARTAKISLKSGIAPEPSHMQALADKGYMSGASLFRQLGFDKISVSDVSTYEGADIQFDLNSPEVPEDLHSRFDTIIDHGTLEHVFHLPNALRNLFNLLRPGGRMIHSSPSGNFFDHGFYMFQPTLFMDFYKANGWDINLFKVGQYTPNQETEPAFFADYEPHMFDAVSYGRMDNKLYISLCVVQKKAESTADVIPVQGAYASMSGWSSQTASAPISPRTHGLITRAINRIKREIQ
jgi:SAM-dependent methyltransferase